MEFWEGAILVVGGIYLVGRMSRRTNPITLPIIGTSIPGTGAQAATGSVGFLGNTVSTNTDGSSALIAGEPLTPAAGPIAPVIQAPHNVLPITSLPVRTPVASAPSPASIAPVTHGTVARPVIVSRPQVGGRVIAL
jgi:hypothetical protein